MTTILFRSQPESVSSDFYTTSIVPGLTQVTQKVAMDQPPYIMNSGTYRSSMDVVAVGFHAHF